MKKQLQKRIDDVAETRKAMEDLISRQARRGDRTCLRLRSMQSGLPAGLNFMATTSIDGRDEDGDDDIRPY